jgi:hypothetical protein
VGLERGPLSLLSTTEELLGRISSGSGLESREYSRRDPSHLSRDTLYPPKLTLTSPINCGRSFGIVRSRTQATEFSLIYGGGEFYTTVSISDYAETGHILIEASSRHLPAATQENYAKR